MEPFREEALYLTKKGISPMKIVLGYNKALSHVTELFNEFVVHELSDFNDPIQVWLVNQIQPQLVSIVLT